MTTNVETDVYGITARAYADGVRVLFAAPAMPSGERGGRGPVSPADLAAQAERLEPVSSDLTQVSAGRLEHPASEVRIQASTQLLVKALTDLEISAYLLQAAEDEEAWADARGGERGRGGLGAIEEQLQIIVGEEAESGTPIERGARAPQDLPAARAELATTIEDALTLITDRAGKTGQSAFTGLLGLGVSELAQAAGVVGLGVAEAFGQAEKATQLYSLCRDFALNAYNALLTLLGPQLAPVATKQVTMWLGEIKEGKLFGPWLERLYEPEQTGQELKQIVADSQAGLEQLVSAIEQISVLESAHQKQAALTDKLVKGLKLLSGIPAAALPQGRLLLAAALLILGAYVVLAGADYVDARRLQRLDRVPGVRHVVETSLQQSEEAR